jgi:hypothetical protein
MNKPYFAVRLALVALLLLALASCRRELYVYGDEFYSVTLDVDWRDYASSDPDGMTVWFYNLDDPGSKPYRTTTSSVRHQDIYLPNGTYQGVIVSYSPEEYSRQQFRDMDDINQARIEATPASYQPKSERTPGVNVTDADDWKVRQALYGEAAWTDRQQPRPPIDSLLYVVANQPEDIGGDTIDRRPINSGSAFGDYIPYKERDYYQSTINAQVIESIPHSLIETMRIRVFISSGFNSLWTTQGSITGLADGHLLPLHVKTENPCLLSISEWQGERTGENQGWVSATITTFGLRPSTILPFAEYHPSAAIGKSRYDGRECDIQAYYSELCDPEDVRLNLAFILRDQHTVCTYNFNVGHAVVSYDDQLVLRIELGQDFFDLDNPDKPDPIVLPDVDAYEGAGFGADVTPWEDGGTADETM